MLQGILITFYELTEGTVSIVLLVMRMYVVSYRLTERETTKNREINVKENDIQGFFSVPLLKIFIDFFNYFFYSAHVV